MGTLSQPQARRISNKNFTSAVIEDFIVAAKVKINNPQLWQLFSQTFPNTLDTTVHYSSQPQPDTYIITGDINAMWLRDSTAQIWPYLPFILKDSNLQNLIKGLINRQAHYILLDPYANAFNFAQEGSIWSNDHTAMRKEIHERKWELDSLCYHIRLVHQYWQLTKDRSIFTAQWLNTAKLIYHTLRGQQHQNGEYLYTFARTTKVASDTLANAGRGNPVNPIGLIASSFRPSDDATIFPFLVPSNFFASRMLHKLAQLIIIHYDDYSFANDCNKMALEIKHALLSHAIVEHKVFGKIFAYEIDGFGSQLLQDDANAPNLLSLPYFDCINSHDPIYQNTRKFILSKANPWYFSGKVLTGLGSLHTGSDHVWPIGIIMQALTSHDQSEIDTCLELLLNSHADTYFMHESINKDNASDYTRPWFAWANSLFAELIVKEFLI
ncbi:MAG: glycoside hydrolase family 125 protein [Burkholderiales bacterium]|nr:glycoside hydrolase family 125 protein [Burkholderiales bacterium]